MWLETESKVLLLLCAAAEGLLQLQPVSYVYSYIYDMYILL